MFIWEQHDTCYDIFHEKARSSQKVETYWFKLISKIQNHPRNLNSEDSFLMQTHTDENLAQMLPNYTHVGITLPTT